MYGFVDSLISFVGRMRAAIGGDGYSSFARCGVRKLRRGACEGDFGSKLAQIARI
jgi:hypothetical protein